MKNAKQNNEASAKAPITLDNLTKGEKVQLAIPASRPIKLLSGVLHEAGQTYKVLGSHGTLARLSRVGDNAKIMIEPSSLVRVGGAR